VRSKLSGKQEQMDTAAPVQTPSVTLAVSGMSCGGCEGAVRTALEAVAGVDRAEVTRERGGEAVVFGPAKTDDLLDAVRATGKDARLVANSA
jgi:copper chaperone CopZ